MKELPDLDAERLREPLNRVQSHQLLTTGLHLLIKFVAHSRVFGKFLLRQPCRRAKLF